MFKAQHYSFHQFNAFHRPRLLFYWMIWLMIRLWVTIPSTSFLLLILEILMGLSFFVLGNPLKPYAVHLERLPLLLSLELALLFIQSLTLLQSVYCTLFLSNPSWSLLYILRLIISLGFIFSISLNLPNHIKKDYLTSKD